MARSASRYGATTRRNLVIAFLAFMTLLLIGQLIRLQVTTARELTARGYDRSLRIQTEDALRGIIYDREGEEYNTRKGNNSRLACLGLRTSRSPYGLNFVN